MNLNYPVIVLGQKGIINNCKENSMKGFLKSIEYGADGISIDVMQIKDNNIIVCDPYSDLALNNDLKNKTTKEISKLKFKNNQKIYPLEKIYFNLPSDTLININVYDKNIINQIINMINSLDVSNRTMISTDNIEVIKYLSDLKNNFFYSLRIKKEGMVREALQLKNDLQFYSININYEGIKRYGIEKFKDKISLIQEENLKILIENFNEPSKIEEFKDYIDVIETKEINKTIEILEKIY